MAGIFTRLYHLPLETTLERTAQKRAILLPAMQTLATALVLILSAAILHVGESPYIAFAFTGAFVTQLMFRSEPRTVLFAILAGAGFAGVYWLHHGALLAFYGSIVAIPGGFLGMGTMFVLATEWYWAEPAQRWRRFELARDAALVPLLCVGSMLAVGPAIGLTPLTYDRMLYLFDAKLAGASQLPPSWVIGRLFADHNWMRLACSYVNNSLPLGLAICLALQWQDRHKKIWYPLDLRWLSMTLGCVGFLLYQFCPAAGPVYLFPKEFPHVIPNLAAIVAEPGFMREVPRNAMPSLHVGWTMLLLWNMRHRAWWLVLPAFLYVAMTAMATLGLGEHYLMDLFVAVPVGLALQAMWLRAEGSTHWIVMGAAFGVVLAWLFAFRTGVALSIPAGATAWTVAGATVVVSIVVAWWMERTMRPRRVISGAE